MFELHLRQPGAHVQLLWFPWSLVCCGFVVVLRFCTVEVCTPVWPGPETLTGPCHTHTPTYRMARLQSTGKPSATEAQLHTSIGILLYRDKSGSGRFSPSVFLSHSHVVKRNQLRPLVAHRSSKEAVFLILKLFCWQKISQPLADNLSPSFIRRVTLLLSSPPVFIFQGLLMRTNYLTSYNPMDMGSPNFFSYNVDALVSMTNQQLEVSNELHMHSLPPRPGAPHSWELTANCDSSLVVVVPALARSSTQPFRALCVWPSSYLYALVLLSEWPEGSPSFSNGANALRARGLWLWKVNLQTLSLWKVLRGIVVKIWWFHSFPSKPFIYSRSKLAHNTTLLWVQRYCISLSLSVFVIKGNQYPIIFPFLLKISEPYKPGATESHRGHKRAEDSATRITGGRDRQSGEFRTFSVDRGSVPHAWALLSHLQWKENPSLTESQVQSIALGRQATVEMEIKRRENVYRDVLSRQQGVRAVQEPRNACSRLLSG